MLIVTYIHLIPSIHTYVRQKTKLPLNRVRQDVAKRTTDFNELVPHFPTLSQFKWHK